MRIVAIIIQPPRLLVVVPGLFSSRTVAWSASSRSLSWSTATSGSAGVRKYPDTHSAKRAMDQASATSLRSRPRVSGIRIAVTRLTSMIAIM